MCRVARPADRKDLDRFIRNGRSHLLAENPGGSISHRDASDAEAAKWRRAFALHRTWSGADEGFFGTPL